MQKQKRRGALLGLVLVLVLAAVFSTNAPARVAASNVNAAAAVGKWPHDPHGVCHIPCGTLTDANLQSLIASMTVSEEDTLAHLGGNHVNGNAGSVAPVPRVGIPAWNWTDGPAGVRLGQVETAMPAPVGLAATWDPSMGNLYGTTVGIDARATAQDGWYAPMMNQVVIPTAGRNFETIGEDAYLAGRIAAGEITGAQAQGFVTEIKHYVDNDFENGRMESSVYVDERTLHEGELGAFESSVKAGALAVMCSYNRLNIFVTPPPLGQGDIFACSNTYTQNQVLKGRVPFTYAQLPVPPAFGFRGNVGSDYGATHRPSDLIDGLDTEQFASSSLGAPVQTAVAVGSTPIARTNDLPAVPAYTNTQWKAALDNAAFHTLQMYNAAGYLEGTLYGKYAATQCAAGPSLPCTPLVPPRPDKAAHRSASFAAARLIADQSAVLLKNDTSLLPLTCADFTGNGVLVMGPTAIAAYTGGSGSGQVMPYDVVQAPYDALVAAATAKCGGTPVISFTPGYDLDGPLLPSTVLRAASTASGYPNWNVPGGSGDPTNNATPGLLRQQIVAASIAISGTQPTLVDPSGNSDRVDPTVNYIPGGAGTLPVNTAWRWTGLFTAPAAGSYQLKIFVADQAKALLFVDGLSLSPDPNNSDFARKLNIRDYTFGTAPTATGSYAYSPQLRQSHTPDAEYMRQEAYTVTLNAGQSLHLDFRVLVGATNPTRVQFRWVPTTNQADSLAAASAAAVGKNKVLDWLYDEGQEGADRGDNAIANGLANLGYQDQVVSTVLAANPNLVVVLNTGDSTFMPWAQSVHSILEMWYAGQMGGASTADILLGAVNPGGKLPETFYDGSAPVGQRFPQDTQPAACEDNTADYGTASGALPGDPGQCPLYPGIYLPGNLGTNLHAYRTINLSDQTLGGVPGIGIFTGYRWFNLHHYTPLFPFGHGLSYTHFRYSGLTITPNRNGLKIQFSVKNTGNVEGDEVPQVYVGDPGTAPVPLAVKALAGFKRKTLPAGKTKTFTIKVSPRSLSYWDVTIHNWTFVRGCRPIYVGSSSADIRLTGSGCPRPPAPNTPKPIKSARPTRTPVPTKTLKPTKTPSAAGPASTPKPGKTPKPTWTPSALLLYVHLFLNRL